MRINHIINTVSQNNYANKNVRKQTNVTPVESKELNSVNFKGNIIPKSLKYLTGGFGSIATFVVFPNPATFVSMFLIGGLLFTAAACTFFDDTDKNN